MARFFVTMKGNTIRTGHLSTVQLASVDQRNEAGLRETRGGSPFLIDEAVSGSRVIVLVTVTKGKTFWRLLGLLLGPVLTMALVYLLLYQVSVSNLRYSIVDEITSSLLRVSERHHASIGEVLALSQTISRDPRVIAFYDAAYQSEDRLDAPKELTDHLLMYRAWRSDLESIVLLGSLDQPILASDDSYPHEVLQDVFSDRAGSEGSVESIRLQSGMQLLHDPSRSLIFLVRPTIIGGRPARLAFLMRDAYPEEALFEVLDDRPAAVEISARGVVGSELLIYQNPNGETLSRPRDDPRGIHVELANPRFDFSYDVWISPETIRADLMPSQRVLVLPLIAGLAIAVALTFLVSARIYRPVRQLVNTFHSDTDLEAMRSPGRDDEIQYVLRSSDELVTRLARMRSSLRFIAPFAAEDIISRALIGGERDAVLSLAGVPGWSAGDSRDVQFMVSMVSLNCARSEDSVARATEELRRMLSALVMSGRVFLIHMHPGVFAVLFVDTSDDPQVLDEALLADAIRLIKDRHPGINVVAGCSEFHSGLLNLQAAFIHAREAHATAFCRGVEITTERTGMSREAQLSRDDETRFINHVCAGHPDEAFSLIAGLLVGSSSGSSPGGVVQAASLVSRAASAVGSEKGRAEALLFRAMSDSLRDADRAVIQAEILNLVDDLCALNDHPDRVVDWPTLREFLETRFHEDLHLAGIADTFGVSDRTLSSLISENSRQTFPELLNSIRCGVAQRLIIEKPLTSFSEIAASVGYRSERTFFRQFKRVTGVRPSDYRRSLGKFVS
jgi:AraC-like DNA-binding protein